jgi:ABC-type dipeptide/oligopeptide/nickel transport system permease subunit
MRASSRVARAFTRNPVAMLGLCLLGSMAFVAGAAPLVAPDSYDDQDARIRLKPPLWRSAEGRVYVLGTDPLGRDVWSRIAYGARVSVSVAGAGLLLGGGVGVGLGLLAGFGGRVVDALVMRAADIQLAFPSLLLAIGFIAVLGANVATLLGVLALRSWAVHARTVRGSVLLVREQESVLAARALGAGPLRLAFREVLPNVLAPLVVVATAQLGALILLESTLSFLGLGIQPPRPSWGNMLSAGRPYITVAWWVTAMPGFAILAAVLGANLLGDGLRDALDPRLKI